MENKRNQLKPGDTIMCIKSFWNAETQTQVKEGYIVKNMAQFGIDCLSHPKCWEKVESTRKQASICRKCGGNGKPSKGYMNFHNIQRNDAKEFETKLLDCIKCESCGHSWIPEKERGITIINISKPN